MSGDLKKSECSKPFKNHLRFRAGMPIAGKEDEEDKLENGILHRNLLALRTMTKTNASDPCLYFPSVEEQFCLKLCDASFLYADGPVVRATSASLKET